MRIRDKMIAIVHRNLLSIGLTRFFVALSQSFCEGKSNPLPNLSFNLGNSLRKLHLARNVELPLGFGLGSEKFERINLEIPRFCPQTLILYLSLSRLSRPCIH